MGEGGLNILHFAERKSEFQAFAHALQLSSFNGMQKKRPNKLDAEIGNHRSTITLLLAKK